MPFSLSLDSELGGVALGVVDDEELVSGLVDGGVAGAAELGLDDVDGGVAGAMLDELDDVEPVSVAGGVVVDEDDEPDGAGVTTGGVFGAVVDDSRLQPATPSTSPVQNSVTNAVLIEVSGKG